MYLLYAYSKIIHTLESPITLKQFRYKVTYWLTIATSSTIVTASPLKREVCLKYFLNCERLITSYSLTKIQTQLSKFSLNVLKTTY
jgi:hypothetical protein